MKSGPLKQSASKEPNQNQLEGLAIFKKQLCQYYDGEYDVEIDENGNLAIYAPGATDDELIKTEEKLQLALKKMFNSKARIGMVTNITSKGLIPREIAVTCQGDKKTILGAYDIGERVVVTLFNIKTHFTAMAYIDDLCSIELACELLIRKVGNNTERSIEIHLISDQIENNKLLNDLRKYFAKFNQIIFPLEQSRVIKLPNIAIDAKNGSLYKDFGCEVLEYDNRQFRETCLTAQTSAYLGVKLPLAMIYDSVREKSKADLLFSTNAKKLSKHGYQIKHKVTADKQTLESVKEAIKSLSLEDKTSKIRKQL